MRFISEAIWDRIMSYTGAYLSGLLLFSLIYASVVSGSGGDNMLYLQIIKSYSPLVLLSVPAAVIVTRIKGQVRQDG